MCIKTVNCGDDGLILGRNYVLLALAIHDLFDGVISVEALIPFKLLFIYKLKSVLNPISEE
jgi:hypothetical protein